MVQAASGPADGTAATGENVIKSSHILHLFITYLHYLQKLEVSQDIFACLSGMPSQGKGRWSGMGFNSKLETRNFHKQGWS